jgi:molybdate ABC transporter permease protein
MTMPLDLSPLWISLKISAIATVIVFFLGITIAQWMWNYRGRGKAILDGFLISPLVLPPTVVGFLLLLLLGQNGPLGQFLQQFGITLIFTWQAGVIASTVVAFPLMYKTTISAFEQIDTNILRAARTLGASEWSVFWRVTLPLALPGIVAGVILAFARALGEFGATLMLAGNIPGQTQTIPVAIFFAAESGDMGQAFFWVMIILGISLGVIASVNYWSGDRRQRATRATAKQRRRGNESPPDCPQVYAEVPEAGLAIDIQKQLANFSLSVNFCATEKPVGLLGASGSGKSMTLRCIAGLETPTAGRIVLNNQVLFDSQRKINIPSNQRCIGFVFQNYALFPHLTVVQNIAFGLQQYPPPERERRVAQQIIQMQLEGLEQRYPHQLSGGQQQRVALARALAPAPSALLLDEPFSALDAHLRHQMEKQLTSLLSTYKGVTLFVTHNLEEAYRVCEKLLVFSEGRAIAKGNKNDIFERPTSSVAAQLTGCKNFSRARSLTPQTIEAMDWDCALQLIEPPPEPLEYLGIRAHHLSFVEDDRRDNTFPAWLVQSSEAPHRITLYLKLNSPPQNPQDYHLQAEMPKDKWIHLKGQAPPWHLHLDPLKIFLMSA